MEELQRVPELVVARAPMKEKIVRWSTQVQAEVASKQESEETEEMVQWRTISKEDINESGKKCLGEAQSW